VHDGEIIILLASLMTRIANEMGLSLLRNRERYLFLINLSFTLWVTLFPAQF